MSAAEVTVVVLAGGSSRRFGADKLGAPLHGSTVLDTVLGSLPGEWPVVVVGPQRECVRPVTWAREDPPGGGPLAGVAAGLDALDARFVVVVAGDMPYAGPAVLTLVAALRTAPPEVGAVVALDGQGVPNPLLAAYRVDALRAALPTPVENQPARKLLEVPHLELELPEDAMHDIDTPDDLAGAPTPGRQ
jgi:molybdopterin-guanine dinucleotide biosynthesis protein A